jgi:hypothetical protein
MTLRIGDANRRMGNPSDRGVESQVVMNTHVKLEIYDQYFWFRSDFKL